MSVCRTNQALRRKYELGGGARIAPCIPNLTLEISCQLHAPAALTPGKEQEVFRGSIGPESL
jgi:hypothetical protein